MLTTAARGGKSRPNGARPASTRGLPAQSCLSDCPGIAYNDSFGGEAEKPLSGTAMERSDDHGRRGNPEIFAASLSLSDGGRDSGDGAAEALRWHKERDGHRVAVPGTLSRTAGAARGAGHGM